jgi:hypothetical protein
MKLSNIVKAISFAAFALSVPASAMIEAEFNGKNLLQSQKMGSQYKRERDLALGAGAKAHHDAPFLLTDTEALIEAAHVGGSTAKFVTLAKNGIKTATNAWIDTLLVGGGANFLDGAVAVGAGNQPANITRDAFKTALDLVIDGVVSAAARPTGKGITALNLTRAAVVGEIDAAVDAWIDTLIGAANMLDPAVARLDNAGAAGTPATIGRDDFKAALSAIITAW